MPNPSKRLPLGGLFLGCLVVAAIIAAVAFRRSRADREVERLTVEMAVPTVTVLHPQSSPASFTLTLPGSVQAYYDAPIYARTNGYLKQWYVDIGDKVKQGQLLAEIETPEIDQQLNQAIAAREQAQANLALARTTSDRWRELYKKNAVAEQDADEKTGTLDADQAALAAAAADVNRLQAMQSFNRVVAPFDGIVTNRKTDIGDLINSGGANQGQELFRIAQTGTLRVYINVPEIYSDSITIGTSATIDLESAPGRAAAGKVVSTAGAIDPASRTLLTEIQIPNPGGKLLPGSYAQVHLEIRLARPTLVVPINTLLFRPAGTQVGIVGSDGVVALKTVHIGRNFGTTVEITDGLSAEDEIILNPFDSLTAGIKVRVTQQTKS